MYQTTTTFRSRRRPGSGSVLLDYALAVALIGIGGLTMTQVLGCRVNNAFASLTHTVAKAF